MILMKKIEMHEAKLFQTKLTYLMNEIQNKQMLFLHFYLYFAFNFILIFKKSCCEIFGRKLWSSINLWNINMPTVHYFGS